ncbi:SpnB-like Rossmann fold domain-containing protein [Nocardia takedensis]
MTRQRPLRVSIEGINGVGKTSAARAAVAELGGRALLLDELTDQPADTLPGLVIVALSAEGDPFLRTGHPVAETLALLALQVRKGERLAESDMACAEVIIEDRGVDTVAVYQAAVLCTQDPHTPPESVLRHVLSSVRPWMALPEATILLTGDPVVCAARFAERTHRTLRPEDVTMLETIEALYRTAAAADPGRYIVLDVTGLSREDSAAAVREVVTTLLDRRAAHAS